jgi:hypothetical protein
LTTGPFKKVFNETNNTKMVKSIAPRYDAFNYEKLCIIYLSILGEEHVYYGRALSSSYTTQLILSNYTHNA